MDDTDLQIQNGPFELFDPCKSVFISVISGEVSRFLYKSVLSLQTPSPFLQLSAQIIAMAANNQ
jgi:hypothetical protein